MVVVVIAAPFVVAAYSTASDTRTGSAFGSVAGFVVAFLVWNAFQTVVWHGYVD